MIRRILGLVFVGIFLAGCMASMPPGRLTTPSGRPEVEIPGVTKKQVIDVIIAREMEKGWDLKSQTDALLIFSKKVNNFGAMLMYGSQYDSTPEGRIKFTLLDTASGVRVFLKTEMITNPGSSFERVTEAVSQEDLDKEQSVLEEIKAQFTDAVK